MPAVCESIYHDVLAFARSRGQRIATSRRPPEPMMPPSGRSFLEHLEMHLGGAFSSRVEKDGPKTVADKLRARAQAGAPDTPIERRGSSTVAAKLQQRSALPPPAPLPKPDCPRGVGKIISKDTRTSLTLAPAVPTRMPSKVVGGQRLAVPAYERTSLCNDDKRQRREAAVQRAARDRAQQLAATGATQEQIDAIAESLLNASAMTQLGAAEGTLSKDDRAWTFWEEFSVAYGWDPVVSRQLAVDFPDLLSSRLGLFLLWVYPKIKGKRLPDANPRSVLNSYPGAICRVLKRDYKLPVPKAATYEAEAKGLLRGYKRVYGVLALAPRRRQPMRRSIWRRVEALKQGELLSGRAPWMTNYHLDTTGLRLGRVLTETAHRLGEVVSYTPDEINYLTREHVTFIIGGVIKIDPTVADLRSMRPGDTALLAPCASKPDQFGEHHCTFPSSLCYDGSATCAAAALRDIELAEPCHGAARATRPLFANEQGGAYNYRTLNEWLHKLLCALLGSAAASTLSWHSFRIELACRLRAANCPDSTIQLICRWACPESVQTYAQLGISQNVSWLQKAAAVQHDAVRTNNLPQLDNSQYFADFESSRERPQRTLDDDDDAPADGSLPSTRTRISVRWGDLWFDGVVSACKRGLDSMGRAATVHHVLYDANHGFRPSRRWHSLADEDWRRI